MDCKDFCLNPTTSSPRQNPICDGCDEQQRQRGSGFDQQFTKVGGVRGCVPACGQERRESHPAALEGLPTQVGFGHISGHLDFKSRTILLVLSIPRNAGLRERIRTEATGQPNVLPIFLHNVGTAKEQIALEKESKQHGDILQV